MRTFEVPAIGGFGMAEDTSDHRALFGTEGKTTLYFGSASEFVEKSFWLKKNPEERDRMAQAARLHITNGGNTYQDRLAFLLGNI